MLKAHMQLLPSPQKEQATNEWEYSSTVQRHNGFIELLAPALCIADKLDDLFVAGSKRKYEVGL